MDKISDLNLFGKYQKAPTNKRRTERGELLEYFAKEIEKPIGYVAMRLTGFQIKDMYYLKSIMSQSDTPSKVFYGSIKLPSL